MTTVITALTKREEEIARFAASGLSNGEVAQRLSLSQYEVKNYLFCVYEKLGISNSLELIFYILSNDQSPESEENEIGKKRFKMCA